MSKCQSFLTVCAVLLVAFSTGTASDGAVSLKTSVFDTRHFGLSRPHSILNSESGDDTLTIAGDSRHGGFRPIHDLAYAVTTTLSDAVHIYSSPIRIDGESALWLLGFASAGGLIYAYDGEMFDALKDRTEHKALKAAIRWGDNTEAIGDGGTTAKFYFGGVLLGYITGFDKLLHLSSDVLESYLIAGGIKNISNFAAGRGRPHEGSDPYFWKHNQGTSFPSGHAANVIQLARIFSHHFDYLPVKVICYGTAGCISLQRVTSDAHWPSDVYAALLYGWFVADEIVKRNHERRLGITPSQLSDGSPALSVMFIF